MEFKPILKASTFTAATIGLNKQGAFITLPGHLLAKSNLPQDARVDLLFGEAGKKKCVRLQRNPQGQFKLTKRGGSAMLAAIELTPKVAPEGKQDLVVDDAGEGQVTFALPEKWDLARRDLIAA